MADLPHDNKANESGLPSDSEFYRNLLDQMSDGVYFVDRKRQILYWNKGAERLAGYSAEEIVGKPCEDDLLCHVDEKGRRLCQEGCPLSDCMADGIYHQGRVFLRHKEGRRVPVEVRAQPMRDANGAIIGAIEIFSDASAQSDAERKLESLRKLAFLDHLTQHPNRRYLEMTLDSALREFSVHNDPPGILLIDLNDFKEINDRHGHAYGDRVLQQVAQTLTGALRPSDVVGRLGGDEFLAIVYSVDLPRLTEMARRCATQVSLTTVPGLQRGAVRLTVSIGGVVAERGETRDEILARADKLMYRSKASGRGQPEIG